MTAIILLITIWCLLVSIERSTNIKLGNKVVQSIEDYMVTYDKLPDQDDWETLKKLNFDTTNLDFIRPSYFKINDSVFELVFTLGFDPPYLMWISNERKWKEDFPIAPEDWYKK